MIKSIRWKEHPILGNLELDFAKDEKTIYNTIILAGENGTGKTKILDTISDFLNLGSFEAFEKIEYIVPHGTFQITQGENFANLGFHNRKNMDAEEIEFVQTNRENSFEVLEQDKCDLRYYGCAYSKARSGFVTQEVKSTTTLQLDAEKYENDSSDDFTSIKQLLVDIKAQDNAAWDRVSHNGSSITYEQFHNTSKIFRFESAFNSFFEDLKFVEINEESIDEKKILFSKHGKSISIDELSTGEKQIVFRGAQLLKNINSIPGGIVLIDEPELSMHPKWQQKILQYYRSLFNKNGTQDVQMIIATHSEYVLRSALEDKDDVLIVILSDDNGVIHSKNITAPTTLPIITSAETNYLAFGIISPDYHTELYGYLQDKTQNYTVKNCDNYIAAQKSFNPALHTKTSSYKNQNGRITKYKTLPTYIRNLIDHPDQTKSYTQEELQCSIELLIKLCR